MFETLAAQPKLAVNAGQSTRKVVNTRLTPGKHQVNTRLTPNTGEERGNDKSVHLFQAVNW